MSLSFNNIFYKNSDVLSESNILSLEKIIKKNFPLSFRDFIKEYDNSYAENCGFFYYSNFFKSYIGSCIGGFLLFGSGTEYNSEGFVFCFKKPPDGFPDGLIRFAMVGNGDEICFDYRADPKTHNPPVVIWEHEAYPAEKEVSFVAKNFETFMNMLISEEKKLLEYERLKKEGKIKE